MYALRQESLPSPIPLPVQRKIRKSPHQFHPSKASSSALPASSATLQKAGPLEVQTLITELEYFSKLQGMASGDKRKEEESAEAAEEVGRASLPWAAEGRRVRRPGRGSPPPPPAPLPQGRASTPTLQGQVPPAGGAEMWRKVRPLPLPLPQVSDPVEDASVGAGRAGGKGCGERLLSGPEQKRLDLPPPRRTP